jgi:hypothetical protein
MCFQLLFLMATCKHFVFVWKICVCANDGIDSYFQAEFYFFMHTKLIYLGGGEMRLYAQNYYYYYFGQFFRIAEG